MSDTPTYWIETLGCPKNQVDSDKLEGTLERDGYQRVDEAGEADLVVVNTCAFVEEAREESVATILAAADHRRPGARLVVTGCMAERYRDELASELPEIDLVAPFGRDVAALGSPEQADAAGGSKGRTLIPVASAPLPDFDLLNLPRPRSQSPWAYVKIAEGCDRKCGFCAIPSFRGPQRSRTVESIVDEVEQLGIREAVLVAQDGAAFGRDQGVGERAVVPLLREVAARVDRVRLMYIYPSDLTDELIETIVGTGTPYFDLSLQHVSAPLLRRMRRWGKGETFLERIAAIRAAEPDATFRSNFIVGYPGETERDHDELLDFVRSAELDWCGFFAFSPEDGTYAVDLDGGVPAELVDERLAELRELQDDITERKRDRLVGRDLVVLVDREGVGRSIHEAPEIDGVIEIPADLPVGELVSVRIAEARGPDLLAVVA